MPYYTLSLCFQVSFAVVVHEGFKVLLNTRLEFTGEQFDSFNEHEQSLAVILTTEFFRSSANSLADLPSGRVEKGHVQCRRQPEC